MSMFKCPICLEKFSLSDIRLLKCGHSACHRCLSTSLSRGRPKRCHTCRAPTTGSMIEPYLEETEGPSSDALKIIDVIQELNEDLEDDNWDLQERLGLVQRENEQLLKSLNDYKEKERRLGNAPQPRRQTRSRVVTSYHPASAAGPREVIAVTTFAPDVDSDSSSDGSSYRDQIIQIPRRVNEGPPRLAENFRPRPVDLPIMGNEEPSTFMSWIASATIWIAVVTVAVLAILMTVVMLDLAYTFVAARTKRAPMSNI